MIILKQKMPLIDGYRLCEMLREHINATWVAVGLNESKAEKPKIISLQPKEKATSEEQKKLFDGIIHKLDEDAMR